MNNKALRIAAGIVRVASTVLEQDMSLRAALDAADRLLREYPDARKFEKQIKQEIVRIGCAKEDE